MKDFDFPADALEAAAKKYCDAWGWSDRGWDDMSVESKILYKKNIQLAIEAFIEKIQ